MTNQNNIKNLVVDTVSLKEQFSVENSFAIVIIALVLHC